MSDDSSSPDNVSAHSEHFECTDDGDAQLVHSNFSAIRGVLLIPLSVSILYLGFQQWRPHRSFRATSHFDIFTYHQSVMELIWGLGMVLFHIGVHFNLTHLVKVGYFFICVILFGETLFHILTCLERYLAVVHPVTYRGLQHTHGDKIRNTGIAFAWLVSWMWSFIITQNHNSLPSIPFLSFLVLSLIVVFFCNLCVLLALIRPGPGGGDKNKGYFDQTKQRAFFTVGAILVVLLLFLLAFIVSSAIRESKVLPQRVRCLIMSFVLPFSLPSSLVLPLLYLYKEGKLSFCSYNSV